MTDDEPLHLSQESEPTASQCLSSSQDRELNFRGRHGPWPSLTTPPSHPPEKRLPSDFLDPGHAACDAAPGTTPLCIVHFSTTESSKGITLVRKSVQLLKLVGAANPPWLRRLQKLLLVQLAMAWFT